MFDPIPNVSRRDVLRIVNRDFPAVDQVQVIALLDEYGTQQGDAEPHRVHVAVLKLSGGSIGKLREHVVLAKGDYRDVLAPAEYPKFWELGLVGVEDLTAKERRQLQEDDWRQYQAWLEDGTEAPKGRA